MTAVAKRRVTPLGMAVLIVALPPIVYGVMGLGAALRRASTQGHDWMALGLAAAMIGLALIAMRAFSKGHRASAAILLFAAYAPLVLALIVMIVVRTV